ncbi:MAG: ABC transporter permease [Gammaproteobacteria bacterium]
MEETLRGTAAEHHRRVRRHCGHLAPWDVISGSPEALRLADTVIIDSLYQDKLEIAGVGDTAEINGHRVRVVGITRGIRSFTTSPFVFTSLKNSLNYARLEEDQTSYLLVRTSGETSPEEIRDRLKIAFSRPRRIYEARVPKQDSEQLDL